MACAFPHQKTLIKTCENPSRCVRYLNPPDSTQASLIEHGYHWISSLLHPWKLTAGTQQIKVWKTIFLFKHFPLRLRWHSHAHQNHTAQRALPGVVEASMNVYQRTWSFDVRETMAVIRKKTKNSQHDRAKQSHHHAFFPGKMHTHLFWNLRP